MILKRDKRRKSSLLFCSESDFGAFFDGHGRGLVRIAIPVDRHIFSDFKFQAVDVINLVHGPTAVDTVVIEATGNEVSFVAVGGANHKCLFGFADGLETHVERIVFVRFGVVKENGGENPITGLQLHGGHGKTFHGVGITFITHGIDVLPATCHFHGFAVFGGEKGCGKKNSRDKNLKDLHIVPHVTDFVYEIHPGKSDQYKPDALKDKFSRGFPCPFIRNIFFALFGPTCVTRPVDLLAAAFLTEGEKLFHHRRPSKPSFLTASMTRFFKNPLPG